MDKRSLWLCWDEITECLRICYSRVVVIRLSLSDAVATAGVRFPQHDINTTEVAYSRWALSDMLSYLIHYAAVLIGRTARLARLFVQPVRAPNSTTKRRIETKTDVNVPQGKSSWCANNASAQEIILRGTAT